MTLPTVATAARNNAEWCDLVCRAHGHPGTFDTDAWTIPRRAPRYYPDAVTLRPHLSVAALMRRIDSASGCSVKDSFATLDLVPLGFGVLFEAEWIGRTPDPVPAAPVAPSWRAVDNDHTFAQWQAGWAKNGGSPSPFRPSILDEPNAVVLADYRDGRVAAGAVLNRSVDVIGVSNLFADDAELDATWAAVVASATDRFPTAAIVGYESGVALAAARRCGFSSLGALRVWTKDE